MNLRLIGSSCIRIRIGYIFGRIQGGVATTRACRNYGSIPKENLITDKLCIIYLQPSFWVSVNKFGRWYEDVIEIYIHRNMEMVKSLLFLCCKTAQPFKNIYIFLIFQLQYLNWGWPKFENLTYKRMLYCLIIKNFSFEI